MNTWEMTKAEYVASQPQYPTRMLTQMHRNAVAAALGESLPVPARVLADYRSYDFSQHPQYRHGSKPAPLKPRSKPKPNLYGLGMAILATHIDMGDKKDA